MANTAQAKKRARQAEKHRALNASQRSKLRTEIKKTVKALATGDADTARATYTAAVPVIDAMARKGLIHKNKAARHKSRLNARLKALAAS
ncbi:MAG: 30S ribosomal protein S20 [Gammaproteobacteria bacterium]|nr:30S ribosomal protein S20 [Gammaproteobacteria bacterium]